ncbi:MAG: gephyrin-like molybdotransferase Glp [Gammaproteobacteria bacterium]
MKSYVDALASTCATVEPLRAESRDLARVCGTTTAADVASRLDVPAFANAAMDGFALRATDTSGAGADNPVQLEVTGITAAGDRPGAAPPPAGAVEIMTGAPMPAECDAVVPIECVTTDSDAAGRILRVRIAESLEPGRNVRTAGEDFRRGDRVLARGRRIEPHDVMALAATGSDRIDCHAAPRIAVITTGSELAEYGAPDDPGMIRNSNGPYLESIIGHIGAVLTERVNAADRPEDLDAAIASARNSADVILTTGGVSAGRYDLIPDAVERAGGTVMFHKVAIRPGKPLLFARLADGTLMFGLPGNPIAAAVGLRFFVVPALRRLQGLQPERYHAAVSEDRIHKRAALRFFGKAYAEVDTDGRLRVHLLHGQESFRIQPLTESNCWVIVPEGPEIVSSGDLVRVAPLYPTGFLQN